MEFKKVKFSVSDGIASIVLNSPENANALDEEMLQNLIVAFDKCAENPDIKVVVLSGEGNHFCSGGDIRMMKKMLDTGLQGTTTGVQNLSGLILKIRNLRKPVIASARGACVGLGFNLALACDFRVAADNTKLSCPFINMALIPDGGGTFLLTRMVGAAKATELIMTGRGITPQEALSLGLVTSVVPADQLQEATLKFAQKLVNSPTVTLGCMKALINRASYIGFENDLDNEAEYQIHCSKTEDFIEAVKSFLEKRKPSFKGR